MKTGTLDIELVQDIQRALRNGRPITEAIGNLKRASLPGIMEYGCLKWAHPGCLPSLHRSVTESTIGQALKEVRSELGLRDKGPENAPPRDTQPRDAEFYVVRHEDDVVDNRHFGEYLIRFEFGAKRIGLPKQTAIELHSALIEMTTNVVRHAKAPVAALVGYEIRESAATFCVVDVGRGVLESLRENPRYSHLDVHSEALRAALHDGVSGVVGSHRSGFGFSTVFKSLAAQWGQLRFRSGEGVITMHGMELDADQGQERDLPFLQGFQVAVSCRTKPSTG